MGGSAESQSRLSRAGSINTFYAWLRLVYGFKDEAVRLYNFNSAPFIDKAAVQQGYVTSEPYEIEKQGGFSPNIFVLSDYGYSTLIETRRDLIEKKPDLVQRFVDTSAIGWYSYLYGDNAKANAMIKAQNPDISDDQIIFSIGRVEGTRDHCFWRYTHARDWCDDRRAVARLLRQDGCDRNGRQAHRL